MSVERFHIHIAEEVLNDLKRRSHHIRWPDQLENSGWDRGADLTYLKSLVSY